MGFLSIFNKVKVTVSAVIAKIMGGQGTDLLSQLLVVGYKLLVQTPIGQLVHKAVVDAQSKDLTGDQKYEQVFADVIAAASKVGISYSNWIVNILIELAVGVVSGKGTVVAK